MTDRYLHVFRPGMHRSSGTDSWDPRGETELALKIRSKRGGGIYLVLCHKKLIKLKKKLAWFTGDKHKAVNAYLVHRYMHAYVPTYKQRVYRYVHQSHRILRPSTPKDHHHPVPFSGPCVTRVTCTIRQKRQTTRERPKQP